MKVYVIPLNKLSDWKSDTFNPVLDANGNYVVAVNADYSQHSFNDELIQCEQINYTPINNIP